MKIKTVFRDLGLIEYSEALSLQQNIFNETVKIKLAYRNQDETDIVPLNYLLFCEHNHVYTLGKSGSEKNLLINPEYLQSINASLFRTNRGGDITYHGPGQLVCYPIIDLEQFNMSLKDHVFSLEEVVIKSLAELSINATRLPGATGVWIDIDKNVRKICAIGVKASRSITMHGFALNINTDLKYFSYINPCGFTDKSVTSLNKELGREMDIEALKSLVLKMLASTYNMELFWG